MQHSEQHETVVIGGGQAGLAAGYFLKQHGRKFVVLDGGQRIGDSWRGRWDSLRLYSPASRDGLPGMAFPAPRASYQPRARWPTTSRPMRQGTNCPFATVSPSPASPGRTANTSSCR